ncbi:MAG: hypothetical protein KDC12_09260, partial [Flavobacteriales bacterium]|nr:hypothetical protein [Flavobacteriales bacterium]
MKKRLIQILVILMTSAFVGLVAIQIYWINNSILLRQQEFDYNVSRAMNKVVQILEKQEYLAQINPETKSSSVKLRSSREADKGLVLEFDKEEGRDTLRLPTNSSPEALAQPARLRPTQQEEELKMHSDSMLFSEWGEYGLEQSEILEQSGFLEDILEGVVTIDIYKSVTERVNLLELDSLVQNELLRQGIKAKYKIGVFNRFHKAELIDDDALTYVDEFFSDGY